MTTVQLCLTAGVPSFFVLLVTLKDIHRFNLIDNRLEQLDRHLGRQFDGLFDEVIAARHKNALKIMRSAIALQEWLVILEAKQAR